ncbi:TIGR02391 family protein [Streptomyces chiangmaiensis]|uniref:TIGR02391 family protein n=1 Tax=Streptomyces chiangmaiensis TaxID=766497 RepID=A0ABU7FNJ7_9ACTN|nr:TIGR02391 family protein [Streptomyces chiangmaiensis]MED7825529.1 TIGR02391 family protein [Streptomyces chiangmaiensis]
MGERTFPRGSYRSSPQGQRRDRTESAADLSETKLFQSAFSQTPPKAGEPRLRLMDDDGWDTFRSIHRGAMAFAEGCCAGIRNSNSHEDGLPELPEHEALEQPAAFSVLARWVDTASVETA